jgi:hypothetical protein
MIKYFTFKKGQPVPMWLIAVTDADTGEQLPNAAVFMSRGKMSLDTDTGSTTIWPAKRNFRCIIAINPKDRPRAIDAKFPYPGNQMIPGDMKRRFTPLSHARRQGYSIYTSLQCEPLPDVKP